MEKLDIPEAKPTGPKRGGFRNRGRGSQQRRAEEYRTKKNAEFDDAIMSGIFQRLKITDPTSVHREPLNKQTQAVVTPIKLTSVPDYVTRVWDTMEAIGTRPFGILDTRENRGIFQKVILMLCEAKLCFAQRLQIEKPSDTLPERMLYTDEELNDLNNLAQKLPYPIAMLLESIGVFTQDTQTVTPVFSRLYGEQDNLSGAMSFGPSSLQPLLRLLSTGVPQGQDVHNVAMALNALPGIEWENGALVAAVQLVKLTDRSRDFWMRNDGDNAAPQWRVVLHDEQARIFRKIIQSMDSKPGFNVCVNLAPGLGTASQIVQIPDWYPDRTVEWYTNTLVNDLDLKLSFAFNLADTRPNVQHTRFKGSPSTALQVGYVIPRRIINSILNM